LNKIIILFFLVPKPLPTHHCPDYNIYVWAMHHAWAPGIIGEAMERAINRFQWQ